MIEQPQPTVPRPPDIIDQPPPDIKPVPPPDIPPPAGPPDIPVPPRPTPGQRVGMARADASPQFL
jgi:protein TonB